MQKLIQSHCYIRRNTWPQSEKERRSIKGMPDGGQEENSMCELEYIGYERCRGEILMTEWICMGKGSR